MILQYCMIFIGYEYNCAINVQQDLTLLNMWYCWSQVLTAVHPSWTIVELYSWLFAFRSVYHEQVQRAAY